MNQTLPPRIHSHLSSPPAAIFLTNAIHDADPSTFCSPSLFHRKFSFALKQLHQKRHVTLLLLLGTPPVISATLVLSSVVPLHSYPLLLLAILEKICGAVAAAPLALKLLQVMACDA